MRKINTSFKLKIFFLLFCTQIRRVASDAISDLSAELGQVGKFLEEGYILKAEGLLEKLTMGSKGMSNDRRNDVHFVRAKIEMKKMNTTRAITIVDSVLTYGSFNSSDSMGRIDFLLSLGRT